MICSKSGGISELPGTGYGSGNGNCNGSRVHSGGIGGHGGGHGGNRGTCGIQGFDPNPVQPQDRERYKCGH